MMKHALPKTLHFGVLALTLMICKLCGSLAACKIEHEMLGTTEYALSSAHICLFWKAGSPKTAEVWRHCSTTANATESWKFMEITTISLTTAANITYTKGACEYAFEKSAEINQYWKRNICVSAQCKVLMVLHLSTDRSLQLIMWTSV